MKRYALVIGVSEYESRSLPKLAKPAVSAEAVARVLEEHGDFQEVRRMPANWLSAERCEVGRSKLTEKELCAELKRFLLEQSVKGEALIYFSGHGFVVYDNLGGSEPYLATSDTKIELQNQQVIWQQNGIPLRSLNKLFLEADLSSLVVLLDCCHSGSLLENSFVQQALASSAIHRDYALIAACRGFEEAYEGAEETPHSIFTTALLKGLGAEQASSNGLVSSDRLSAVIAEELRGKGQEALRMSWGRPIPLVTYPKVVAPPATSPVQFCPENPYRGLYAFEEEHAEVFYGREKAAWDLLSCLMNNRFLAVIGASGSGKSSLVKAGLLPKIRQGGIPGSDQWLIQSMTPGKHPLQRLLDILAELPQSNQPLLLLIDQFEEVFTLCEDETEKQHFMHLITNQVNSSERSTRIVVTIRGDFLVKCAEYDIADLINRSQPTGYVVKPLSRQELEAAIAKPAAQHGVTFEPGLVRQIVSDVLDRPGALPLLQYALKELWQVCIEKSNSPQLQLTWAGYDQIGGVGGALEKRADLLYNSFNEAEQAFVHRLFVEELVQPGDNQTVTRRRTTWERLEKIAPSPELLHQIVKELADQRLLVTDETTVEVAHESLLIEWKRLHNWIEQEREQIDLRRQLEASYRDWQEKYKKHDDALLMGAMLATIEEKLNWHNLPEAEYVDKSLQRRHRETQYLLEQERQLRQEAEARAKEASARVQLQKQKNILAIASLICIATIAVFAGIQWRAADFGQIQALTTSSTAKFKLNRYSFDALIDALKAGRQLKRSIWFRNDPTLETEVMEALSNAVYWVRESNRLEKHNHIVQRVTFSPDGTIATASYDNTVKLWNPQGKELATLKGHTEPVVDVSFSPDGNTVATASIDGTVRLWREGKLFKQPIKEATGTVWTVRFSPDGRKIATAGKDKIVKLWDLNGNFLNSWNAHDGIIYSLSFSDDGQKIATASEDKTVKLWDLNGKLLHTFTGHGNQVNCVSFSRDGQTLASGSSDKTVILWDVNQKRKPIILKGHEKEVNDVTFSPDKKTIATASGDGTVKLWGQNGLLLATLEGHKSRVNSVSFNKDGNILASAGADKTVKLWPVNTWLTPLAGHDSRVYSVDISRDDKIATASGDKTVKLWNLQGQEELPPLTGHNAAVSSVSFSPNGKMIATGSEDKTVKLWNLQEPAKTLTDHKKIVNSVSFSPDGKMIASGSSDTTVKLWTPQGNLINTLQGNAPIIYSVNFSPDRNNTKIAAANSNGTVQLWSGDGKPLRPPWKAHNTAVYSIRFSPDGKTIATASEDNTVKLWHQDGRFWKSLNGHTAGVSGLAFSNDGKKIATASDDRTVKIWTSDGVLITTLLGHSDAVNSVSFSRDSRILATASSDQTALLWNVENLSLDNFMKQGCNWLGEYMKNNQNAPRNICEEIKR